jgi:PmbA protein
MITPEQRDAYRSFCDDLIDFALRQGCAQARAELNHIEHFNIDTHNHKLDTLQQSTGVGLTMRLFVDGRYGTYSTNRLERVEVEQLIRRGIEATRHLGEDPCRTLPDPARYYHPAPEGEADLGVYCPDITETDLDVKKELALATAACTGAHDRRIISLDTSLQDRLGWQYLTDSQGFRGESRAGICSLVASINMQGEGDSRPSDYEHLMAVSYADLRSQLVQRNESIADSAHRRVYCKIGARPVESGTYTIIVEARVVGKLLDPMLDVLYGANLYQQRSFLGNKLDQVVASPLFTLRDEPHRPGAQGACYFDFEGVATAPCDIFREGRLCTHFIDTYYGHKLHRAPTNSGPTVLSIEPGQRTLSQIISSTEHAIYLTGFNGGNYNEVTGDYSFGIEGVLVEHGELTTPVAEMNLTGNLVDLWQHLVEVGSETTQTATGYIPSLVFEGCRIA